MPENTLNAPARVQVSSLPVDALLIIFEMLRSSTRVYYNDSDDDEYDASPKTNLSLSWVPEVTHVCHSWREAALLTSCLWSDINVEASTLWAVEFAHRSGQAPISIILESFSSYYEEWTRQPKVYECTKTLIHENRHRFREIRLQAVGDEAFVVSSLSDELASGPGFFPILESLEISLDYRYNYESSFLLTNRMLVAPTLKRLSLGCCSVEEDFGSFRNLSGLSIRAETYPIVTANFLRRALLEMPKLEKLVLKLESEQPSTSVAVDFGSQVAALPKLHHIEIEGWPFHWVMSILQMISCGPRMTLSLSGFCVNRLEHFGRLLTCIMSHVKRTSMRRMQLCLTDPTEFCVTASENIRTPDLKDEILLQVKFPSPLDEPRSHPKGFAYYLLDGVLRRMKHQNLRSLDLYFTKPLSASVLVEFFGKLPSLHRIRIFCGGERELFAALTMTIQDGTEPRSDTFSESVSEHTDIIAAGIPFPALKKVTVYNLKRIELYSEEDMVLMLKCLQKRMDLGIGLKKLSFMVGGGQEKLWPQLNAFRSVVRRLEI